MHMSVAHAFILLGRRRQDLKAGDLLGADVDPAGRLGGDRKESQTISVFLDEAELLEVEVVRRRRLADSGCTPVAPTDQAGFGGAVSDELDDHPRTVCADSLKHEVIGIARLPGTERRRPQRRWAIAAFDAGEHVAEKRPRRIGTTTSTTPV